MFNSWNRFRKRSRNRRYNRRTTTSAAIEILEDRLLLSATWGLDPAPIDGVGNNVDNPQWGSADVQLLRLTTGEYGDGISTPAGEDRPSAREISNAVVAQDESIPNDRNLTDLLWLWGQFVDHDIDLTENANPAEPLPIAVPEGDPDFDPGHTGTAMIGFNRSVYDTNTGDSQNNIRQQINQITAFIDGSNVYGSDSVRAAALRTFVGGTLKTSAGDLLPFNVNGLPNAGGPSADFFLAGDVRANENAALSAMHTLFVREHNRIADEIEAENPSLTDEEIYQHARAVVTAEIQAITYNEFLPAWLGPGAIDPYAGYDPTVNPGISNIFSTASYRLGHSLLSTELLRLNNDGSEASEGNLALKEAFFAPDELIDYGIDSILLGVASHLAQEVDAKIVDDVRNFLFGPPGSGGFDLASLNIQRGRDHGLADYNQARVDFGLDPVTSFADITSDPELQQALEQVYGDVNEIDVWVGGLAEDHLPGSSVGELLNGVLVDQFERLRDGDRYWYQNVFSGHELHDLEKTTLADVIRRNTSITNIQDHVFYDDSVFVYRAPAGEGPIDVTLRTTNSHIILVDNHSGTVLQAMDLQWTSAVAIYGTDGNDHISVHPSLRRLDAPIEIHGIGGYDQLHVRATMNVDNIVVDARRVTINDIVLFYGNVEEIVVAGGDRDDSVTVYGETVAHVTLESEKGDDPCWDEWGDDWGDDWNDDWWNDWGDDPPTDTWAETAYELDQILGLEANATYNWGGVNEKWIGSASGTWYFLTEEGKLYKWTGSKPGASFVTGSELVATFDASYYADPTKLTEAPDPAAGGGGGETADGGVDPLAQTAYDLDQSLGLVADSTYDWGGVHEKWLGSASGAWYFMTEDGSLYEWTGSSPGAGFVSGSQQVAIFDASYYADLTKLTEAPWPTASSGGAPGGAGAVDPLAQAAYNLDQSLRLEANGTYDWGGAKEKWLGSASGTWYFVTEDGSLYKWIGSQPGAGFVSGSELVAIFDASYYADPSKLFDAKPTNALDDVFTDPDVLLL